MFSSLMYSSSEEEEEAEEPPILDLERAHCTDTEPRRQSRTPRESARVRGIEQRHGVLAIVIRPIWR